ncbi:hypothetical protein G7046_g10124 [Stylonectria norvegica]|nr:hypothetical protein G7046_g10124 [Stylonectria norvegica]
MAPRTSVATPTPLAPTGTYGAHNSRVANAADPRIDSDRDGSKNIGGHSHTTGTHGTTGGLAGTGSHGSHNTGAPEGTYGTHNSRVANAADPRIDSDRDGSKHAGGHSNTTHGTTGGLTGTGTHNTTHNQQSTTSGTAPHNSHILNVLDPRVDSDNSKQTGSHSSTTTGTHGSGTHSGAAVGLSGPTHVGNQHAGSGSVPEGTYGTHNSRVANAADPRIDSDRDGSHHQDGRDGRNQEFSHGTGAGFGNTGLSGPPHGTGSTYGNTGLPDHEGTHAVHSGTHGTHGATSGSNVPEGTYGTHNSRVANAADPRIDSDRDGSHHQSGTTHGTHGTHDKTHSTHDKHDKTHGTHDKHDKTHGTTGVIGGTGHNTHGTITGSNAPEGTYGTHNSRAANAADPRIDSDRDGSRSLGNTGSIDSSSTGPAPKTAGPHKSDLLNKLDPRVDSNLDGSKTIGGDKTYSNTNQTGAIGGAGHNTHSGSTGTGVGGVGHNTSNTSGTGIGGVGHNNQTTGTGVGAVGHNNQTTGTGVGGVGHNDQTTGTGLGGQNTQTSGAIGGQHNSQGIDPAYAGKDPRDAAQVPPSVMQSVIGAPVVAHDHKDADHSRRHSVSHQEKHTGL